MEKRSEEIHKEIFCLLMYHSPVAAELLLVYTIAFSDDGSWFVLGGQDGRILLWPTNKAIDVQ